MRTEKFNEKLRIKKHERLFDLIPRDENELKCLRLIILIELHTIKVYEIIIILIIIFLEGWLMFSSDQLLKKHN